MKIFRSKNLNKFQIIFFIKKCAYGLKMKPRQFLDEYFEAYGQGDEITQEAEKKKGSFLKYNINHA